MKKLIVVFMLVLFLPIVVADGWHVSDRWEHLYEPSQKAVIFWDGQKETMILSSAVKAEDVANFAWVVPIQSSVQPTVEAGNISIFEDLVDYFTEERNGFGKFGIMAGGVEVLETKEIDVYDITILKATSADDLIDWLNENGYQVPETAKPVLEKYVLAGDFYFVANKIDLSNKYSEILGLDPSELQDKSGYSKEYIDNFKHRLTLEVLCKDYFYITDPYENFTYNEMKELQGVTYESLESLKQKHTLGDERFCGFLMQFGYWPHETDLKAVFNPNTLEDCNGNIRLRRICKQTGVGRFGRQIFEEGCYKSETDHLVFDFYKDENFCATVTFNNYFRDRLMAEGELEEVYNQASIAEARRVYNSVLSEFSFLDETFEHWEMAQEYQRTLRELQMGMGTPLKFEFYPPKPFYPLEISSLNLGHSKIDVYVIGENPVLDRNGVMTMDKSKRIDSDLRSKLKEHADLGNARYVTRLIYEGPLNMLGEDAIFVDTDEPLDIEYEVSKFSFFRMIWNWFK
ncbi:MAG: DUF2330 domain-containing protein [Nanoarchaeota archaeon]|nr:DUF2330 domain-containing protein [Nanoarchaeota archaeon]